MKKECKIALFVLLISFFFIIKVFADGGVYWQENGVLLCEGTFGG